jgi:hypothetical protein
MSPSQLPLSDMLVEATLEAWADAGRCSQVPIQGVSMAPLLQPGDTALVVHGRQHLRIGEVLAYRLGEQVVVHRLLRRLETGWLLMGGDNHVLPDRPIAPPSVLGRVVAVKTPGRQVRLDVWPARILGWGQAACLGGRKYRGVWRATRWFTRLVVRMLRS